MEKVIFEGRILAETGIYQPSPVKGREGDNLSLSVAVQTEDGWQVVRVPVISGNTIRAILRDNISKDILFKFDNIDDFDLVNIMLSGGTIEKTDVLAPDKLALIEEFRRKNVVVSLFGGAHPKLGIMAGKLISHYALPLVKETAHLLGMSPEQLLPAFKVTDEIGFIRKDDLNSPDVLQLVSSEVIQRYQELIEQAIETKKKREEEKKKQKLQAEMKKKGIEVEAVEEIEVKEINEEKVKKQAFIQMIQTHQYIVAGTEFVHKLVVCSPDDKEIGALLTGFSYFAKHPYIGSAKSRGFGRIRFSYTVTVDGKKAFDFKNKDIGHLLWVNHDDEYSFERFIRAYEEYRDGLKSFRDINI